MLKFIVPFIIVLLIVLYWEKISDMIYRKFNLKLNPIIFTIFLIVIGIVFALLYF